jgi:L-fucose mutarotase
MLKGIPDIISPELLKILHEMGHGDELVIGDANFPAASNAKRLVRCDGHDVAQVLDAILKLFPMDIFVETPVTLMGVVPGDRTVPVIHEKIKDIVQKYDERGGAIVGCEERFAFYQRAKEAYVIIATSERKLYGCVIIRKGIIA